MNMFNAQDMIAQLKRRADACARLANDAWINGLFGETLGRLRGKVTAYRHAAELVEAEVARVRDVGEVSDYERALVEAAVQAAVAATIQEIVHESGERPMHRHDESWAKWIEGGLTGKLAGAGRFEVSKIVRAARTKMQEPA
jgi:hypothetical protein